MRLVTVLPEFEMGQLVRVQGTAYSILDQPVRGAVGVRVQSVSAVMPPYWRQPNPRKFAKLLPDERLTTIF
jgi:hypothetical protein